MGNFFGFSTLVTRVAPTTTGNTSVFSGAIVKVWGFSVSNTSAGTVTATVKTNEATPTTLWTASMPTNTNISVPIPFIADTGLQVTTSSANALSFTFYHSQVGA